MIDNITIEHDVNREREVQFLCKKIKETDTVFVSDDSWPDRHVCVFCGRAIYIENIIQSKSTMSQIKHKTDCIYNIAIGLSTKDATHE